MIDKYRWIVGWIFPPLWLIGIPFIASWSGTNRRKAGVACLISLLFYILYCAVFYVCRKQVTAGVLWFFEGQLVVGLIVTVVISVYLSKRVS